MLSYREIRRDFQDHPHVEPILVDYYAKAISPVFTRIFVQTGLTPNRVTVLMMMSGVLGAVLFALPQLGFKVLGMIFIHSWYILDCSDGEVARITQRFSKFGKEIDYAAHMVNHPLFNLAFAYALIGLGKYDISAILLIAALAISAELVVRNLLCFYFIYDLKMGQEVRGVSISGAWKSIAVYVAKTFSIYPNFVLVFPILYFIDCFFGTSYGLNYMILQTAFSCFAAGWGSFKWVRCIVSM